MTDNGPIHVLRVEHHEPSDPQDEPEVEYTIVHPDECPTYLTHFETTGYECLVGFHADAIGTREAVGVEPDWKTREVVHYAPGEYRIQGYTETHDIPGNPIEYEQGITFLDEPNTVPPVIEAPATHTPVTFKLVTDIDTTLEDLI